MESIVQFSYNETIPTPTTLKYYENVPIHSRVYDSIAELLSNHPNIHADTNVIVHVVNGNSGFGSQLTLFMQTLRYFFEHHPNILVLPHFSQNTENFKYHER